jgi:translation initiation factor 2B subunit (eIF-2B alpha/beta/delta family)
MKLNSCTSEDDEKSVRDSLISIIDDFRSMINMAADAVYEAAVKKMQDGDVILTYGW